MKLLFVLYREKIGLFILCGFLLIWALTASMMLTFRKREVTLLQLNDGIIFPIGGYTQLNKMELKQIELSFVTSFINSYYHFDLENFDHNMEIAKGFFSETGWENKLREVSAIRQEIQNNFVSQGAIILNAKKVSPDSVRLKVKFYSAVGGETKISFRNITLSVRRRDITELSEERPYPFEVTNVIEESF